jgi:hypothetical protein
MINSENFDLPREWRDIGLTATPTRTDKQSERSLTATRVRNGSNVPSP